MYPVTVFPKLQRTQKSCDPEGDDFVWSADANCDLVLGSSKGLWSEIVIQIVIQIVIWDCDPDCDPEIVIWVVIQCDPAFWTKKTTQFWEPLLSENYFLEPVPRQKLSVELYFRLEAYHIWVFCFVPTRVIWRCSRVRKVRQTVNVRS